MNKPKKTTLSEQAQNLYDCQQVLTKLNNLRQRILGSKVDVAMTAAINTISEAINYETEDGIFKPFRKEVEDFKAELYAYNKSNAFGKNK